MAKNRLFFVVCVWIIKKQLTLDSYCVKLLNTDKVPSV